VDRGPEKWTGTIKPDWIPPKGGYHTDFILFLQNSGRLLRDRCVSLVRGTPLEKVTENDVQWQIFLENAKKDLPLAVHDWEKDYESLRDAWVEIPRHPSQPTVQSERSKANSIRYQIKAIGDVTVIEWFSDAGFLPRYGFPIHLQRLSVRVPQSGTEGKSTSSEKYRLERQSLIALSEYVPGAELLAGG
jgi:hypothetical protein